MHHGNGPQRSNDLLLPKPAQWPRPGVPMPNGPWAFLIGQGRPNQIKVSGDRLFLKLLATDGGVRGLLILSWPR